LLQKSVNEPAISPNYTSMTMSHNTSTIKEGFEDGRVDDKKKGVGLNALIFLYQSYYDSMVV